MIRLINNAKEEALNRIRRKQRTKIVDTGSNVNGSDAPGKVLLDHIKVPIYIWAIFLLVAVLIFCLESCCRFKMNQ